MNELSVGSDDEVNKQEFTRTVQSSNRRKQRPPGVKVADKPDEYDYDSSDEEVSLSQCGEMYYLVYIEFSWISKWIAPVTIWCALICDKNHKTGQISISNMSDKL